MRLAYPAYLDVIAEEAARLSEQAGQSSQRAVPGCPGWTIADLLAHLEGVYLMWQAQLLAAHVEGRTGELLPGPNGTPEALEQASSSLVKTLEELGPNSPCWNWTGEDLISTWVARRVALESAVHRVDVELALGKAHPIETELAADGIEERIMFLNARLPPGAIHSLGGSLCLVCDDIDAAWLIELERGRLRWRSGRGPAGAVVVASASDLLLFSWNRVALDVLSLTGDPMVAQAWHDLPA